MVAHDHAMLNTYVICSICFPCSLAGGAGAKRTAPVTRRPRARIHAPAGARQQGGPAAAYDGGPGHPGAEPRLRDGEPVDPHPHLRAQGKDKKSDLLLGPLCPGM